MTRIGISQIIVLVGLVVILVSALVFSQAALPLFPMVTLPILLDWIGFLVFVAGLLITLSGVFGGPDRDPFDLFVIGLVILGGGLGMFGAAGFAQWNPTVDPLWIGAGPKPEAVLIGLSACLQAVVGFVVVLMSLPLVFSETRRLTRA